MKMKLPTVNKSYGARSEEQGADESQLCCVWSKNSESTATNKQVNFHDEADH